MKSPNIILYGPPGTGKTYSTVSVAAQLVGGGGNASWKNLLGEDAEERNNRQERFSKELGKRIHFITFHQSYSYEDFIGGLRPVARPKTITTPDQAQPANPNSDGGSLQFEWTAGIFLRACAAAFKEAQNQMATKWPTGNQTDKDDVESFLEFCGQAKLESYKEAEGKVYPFVILVIDEINRANMSRVFGELITLLEDDKRLGGKEQLIVQLPNRPDCKFGVPKNLIIIGTMNTADKSLALLDLALRRRFEFHRLDPDPEKVQNQTLREFMKALNEAIAKERKSLDYGVGHAYFMREGITPGNLNDVLTDILQRKIVPLLQEYFGGDDAKVIKVLKAASVDLETEDFGTGTDRDLLIKMPIKVVKCALPQPTPL